MGLDEVFSKDELRTIKQVMEAIEDGGIDLSKLPELDIEQRDTMVQFLVLFVVLPMMEREGLIVGDDAAVASTSVSNAVLSQLVRPTDRPISYLTFATVVARYAYDRGVIDTKTGLLSDESVERIVAYHEEDVRREDELRAFHNWLKDL